MSQTEDGNRVANTDSVSRRVRFSPLQAFLAVFHWLPHHRNVFPVSAACGGAFWVWTIFYMYSYSIIAPTTFVVWLFIVVCAFVLFVFLFYLFLN